MGTHGEPRRTRVGRDAGQISVLVIGLFAITALLILGGIDVTAAHVARVRLIDAADAAALDAADALDERGAYGSGIGSTVVLSDATVRQVATDNLGSRTPPAGVTGWGVVDGTGTPDGQTAVVVVSGEVLLPMTGGVLAALGRSVTVTVEGRARAPLR